MTECSIVIPTYERPGYLKRILGYYNDSHAVYNLIIADGSSEKIRKLNSEIVLSFPGLSIQHLDKYSFGTTPDVRIADALEHVTTRYCVFCADDDFITPNGIKQSVEFLEKNPDFTAAHGRYLGFYLREDGRGNQQLYWVPSFDSHESITFSDPVMRFSHHLSEYSQSTFYAVRRTDFLKMIYAENIKFTFNGLLIELFLSMLTLIYGKLKFLDVLYAARDSGSTPVTGYRPTLKDTIESGTYDNEYARFRECLSVHLSKHSHLSINESTKQVDKAMASYLKRSGIPKRRIEFESKMRPVLDSLNLPDWVNRKGKRLYAGLTGLRQDKKLPVETPVSSLSRKDFIKMTVSSKDYDDFERIRVHVLSSSE